MHRIRRFYYKNKGKIWKTVLIVALILVIIQLLEAKLKEKSEKQNIDVYNSETYSYEENDGTYISGTSAITGSNISKKEVQNINDTISKFLQHCKKGEIEQAYKMVSEDCKEQRYNTIEKFKQEYVEKKFNKSQIYEIKQWQLDTYRVEMSEDMLSTGKIQNNEKIVEYITIAGQDGNKKLNISEYIGQEKINKEAEKNKIKIKVISKKIYMDYEEYELEIQNLSNKTIKLDSLESTETIYLKDRKGNKYKAYMHELAEEDLIIDAGRKHNLSIKFVNTYDAGRVITNILFKNLILDYKEFQRTDNKQNLKSIVKFDISI